jgi:hypothetical protein
VKPLVIVPTYMTEPEDVETCRVSIASVRTTQGDSVDVLAVDDGSPEPGLVDELEQHTDELSFELFRKDENTGFTSGRRPTTWAGRRRSSARCCSTPLA